MADDAGMPLPPDEDDAAWAYVAYDEEAEAKLDAEAIADFDAGRSISHEAVMRWVRSLGTVDELPPPKVGD